jgi:lactoylglutathione lyase
MKFILRHTNINVKDLSKSLEFYKKALWLEVIRSHKAED